MTQMPAEVQFVMEKLGTAGFEAWCVGGCVRDSLLGIVPGDWDVTTSALPRQVMELFGPAARPTGMQHGTVSVTVEGCAIEVTTYRIDGNYRDYRRPQQVSFTASLEEDLQRRDFTINAMAVNLRGELRDPFGGQKDLGRGLLRCVGCGQERFQEDALRILRGLRFAARLDLEIEETTADGMHHLAPLLAQIAPERIAAELTGLLAGPAASRILRQFYDVIAVFWPEIAPMVGFDQRNEHHCYDIWEHSLHAMDHVAAEDRVLRFAALLHDIGKTVTFTLDEAGVGHFYGHGKRSVTLVDAMLRRLRYPNAFRQKVLQLVDWHDRQIPPADPSVGRALRQLGEEDLRRLIALKRADNLAQAPRWHCRQEELDLLERVLDRLLREEVCYSLRQLAVNGRDVMKLGLSGKEVGQALDAMLAAVETGEAANEREKLLAWLQQHRN